VSVKVLLVDNSAMMREAIRGMLAEWPEVEVVGEAANFARAMQMASALRPQVVVIDLHLNDPEPANLCSRLHMGGARLLAMSFSNDDEAKALAQRIGSDVLLDKMDLYNELVPKIIQLASPNAAAATA
jgi:DNA-binding NarL/FixJ family response regulator